MQYLHMLMEREGPPPPPQKTKKQFVAKAALYASIGVKAQAACSIYLKCMTVRIIAMSNPLGLSTCSCSFDA